MQIQEKMETLPKRQRRTLRAIGLWTVVGLVAYFIIISLVIAFERDIMLSSVARLQEVHGREERLVALNVTVARTVLVVNESYFSPDLHQASKVLILEIEAILPVLKRLETVYPLLQSDLTALRQVLGELSLSPDRGAIALLRNAMNRLVVSLDVITADVHAQKQRIVQRYQDTFNRVTVEWLLFGVLGLAILGGAVLAFFRHLAFDIDRVRDRAVAIVSGYRGGPLEHQRGDELGALMDAINKMQQELRHREAEIEIVRMQQFHKEKMAAVGSLAGAVAHEINNPMSAIVGVAQAMKEVCGIHGCSQFRDGCHPDMILDQAKRVMQITRRISEFSMPQSPDRELLDINGLLRSTCNFVAFDRRFRLIELATDLDSNLPAVTGTADHLVQVAMNLLINAADSLENQSSSSPRILVRTRQEGASVRIEFVDNGVGIPQENLERVFEEHFTTKDPERGSGLGLAVCRSLLREAGGEIQIASRLDAGTTVTISLPIAAAEDGGERHSTQRG